MKQRTKKAALTGETADVLNKVAVFAPFTVVAAMTLVALGYLPGAHFSWPIYMGLSLALAVTGLLRAMYLDPPDHVRKLALVLFHILGGTSLLFVFGLTTPFIVFWALLLFSSYVHHKRIGFAWSFTALLAIIAIDMAFVTPSDAARYLEILIYAVFAGTAGYMMTLFIDSTSASEDALDRARSTEAAERDRMHTLLNSMAEGVITTNTKGTIKLHNAAALSLLDTNENLTGKSIDKIFKLVDTDGKAVHLSKVLEGVKTVMQRTDLTHNLEGDDSLRLSLQITQIRASYHSNKEPGFVIIFRDITKEKTLEEERDEFISVVSHELRTPVTIVEGSISNLIYMQSKGSDPKVIKNAATEAHKQVIYLANMINDLSTLSRAERGVSGDRERINMRELMQDLYKKYEPEAIAKGLRLDLDAEHTLPDVYQSRLYLEEILQNFITNAIKYTMKGGVTLHASVDEYGGVLCSVSDTGIGVSKTDQEKIFLKFYRAEDYRTRETNGTGLGLYVVKKLADKMGVTIKFKSRLNHGSTFSFRMPPASGASISDSEVK